MSMNSLDRHAAILVLTALKAIDGPTALNTDLDLKVTKTVLAQAALAAEKDQTLIAATPARTHKTVTNDRTTHNMIQFLITRSTTLDLDPDRLAPNTATMKVTPSTTLDLRAHALDLVPEARKIDPIREAQQADLGQTNLEADLDRTLNEVTLNQKAQETDPNRDPQEADLARKAETDVLVQEALEADPTARAVAQIVPALIRPTQDTGTTPTLCPLNPIAIFSQLLNKRLSRLICNDKSMVQSIPFFNVSCK